MSEQHITDKEADGLGFALIGITAFALAVVFGPIAYACWKLWR